MNSRIERIGELLLEEIVSRFDSEPLDIEGLEFSESFAEMLDRFIVLHIRMWKLEDAIGDALENGDDDLVVDLKRKVDYCFKDRRPKLTKAINCFLDSYVNREHCRKFSEENVKLYRGHKN